MADAQESEERPLSTPPPEEPPDQARGNKRQKYIYI
jgi:hypothetical protein